LRWKISSRNFVFNPREKREKLKTIEEPDEKSKDEGAYGRPTSLSYRAYSLII
jgi:hypothetical protein